MGHLTITGRLSHLRAHSVRYRTNARQTCSSEYQSKYTIFWILFTLDLTKISESHSPALCRKNYYPVQALCARSLFLLLCPPIRADNPLSVDCDRALLICQDWL